MLYTEYIRQSLNIFSLRKKTELITFIYFNGLKFFENIINEKGLLNIVGKYLMGQKLKINKLCGFNKIRGVVKISKNTHCWLLGN